MSGCARGSGSRPSPPQLADALERAEAGIAELSGRLYPIQDGPAIPWRLLTPHERQAVENHDQTLKRLAQRGGLGCAEALAILDDEQWHRSRWSKATNGEARAELIRRVESDVTADRDRLRTENARLREALGSLVDAVQFDANRGEKYQASAEERDAAMAHARSVLRAG